MELWIRSQDKMNLACVYSLYVIERDFAKNDSIWWEIFCNDEISLGLYLKERALEVLDEIQNILKPQLLIRRNDDNDKVLLGALQKGVTQKIDMEYKELSTYVYEMPKE